VRVAPRTLHVPLDRIEGRGPDGTDPRDGRTDSSLLFSPLVVAPRRTRAREGTDHSHSIFVYSFSLLSQLRWQMASKQL
jgi:hypothetical protein